MRIMLVDDDERLRQVIRRFLNNSGYTDVIEAADGQAALALLADSPVHLIVSDMQMPHLDGIAFARQLRESGNQTPIVMLSGQDDPHLIVIAIRAGVNNYVPKPVNPEVLAEKIRQTLAMVA